MHRHRTQDIEGEGDDRLNGDEPVGFKMCECDGAYPDADRPGWS